MGELPGTADSVNLGLFFEGELIYLPSTFFLLMGSPHNLLKMNCRYLIYFSNYYLGKEAVEVHSLQETKLGHRLQCFSVTAYECTHKKIKVDILLPVN